MSNNNSMPERKIWFVKHPISQYKENVKLLARKHHLRILDAQFEGQYPAEVVEQDPPKLTVEKTASKKSAKASEASAVDVNAIKAAAEAEAAQIIADAKAKADAEIKAAQMQAKATTDAAAKAAAKK